MSTAPPLESGVDVRPASMSGAGAGLATGMKAWSLPVLVVSHGFQSNYERGFCNGLVRRGWEVALVSSDRTDYEKLHPGVDACNLRGSQDENRRWWVKLGNILRYHARLLGLVWQRRQAWVVHVIGLTEPPLLCGVLEGLWLRFWSRRYVLTVHDLLPHDRHTLWRRWVNRLVYRIPHTLVVHTERMAAELERDFGVDPARIVRMEHGVEPGLPKLGSASNPRSSGALRLLFFGNVMRYKGLDVLLEALENFDSKFELVISGLCIDRALADEISCRIAAHPFRDRIRWTNAFVPESSMESLFGEADALVLPYRHIDQSGVLFQALRHGLPVVATRAGSLADYVGPAIGELCEPNSVQSLRNALERFSDRLSTFSREFVQEQARRFEWSLTVGGLEKVYTGEPFARRAAQPIIFVGQGRLGNQVFQYVAMRARLGGGTLWTTGLDTLQRVFDPLPSVHRLMRGGLPERLVRRALVPLLVRPLFRWLRLGDYCREPEHQVAGRHAGASGSMQHRSGLLPLTFVDGGYYQNLRYLLEPKDFQCLRVREDVLERARNAVQQALQGRKWPKVAMHVRRGDYIGWSAYGLDSVMLPDAYFRRAIGQARRHVGCDAEILVVSDDAAWCHRELSDLAPLTVLSVDETVDFALLSMFPVVVLSNSTFSLAAACVGREVELIIGPEYWFGHAVRRWLPFHIRSGDPRFCYL